MLVGYFHAHHRFRFTYQNSAAQGNAITVFDPDAGENSLRVQLIAEDGSISETELIGSQAELNALLDGIIFTPDTDFLGEAFLDIFTEDFGHHGIGEPPSTTSRFTISVS
jgi:hypothetical protein